MNKFALTVENLTKIYAETKTKKRNKALNELNFAVEQGEILSTLVKGSTVRLLIECTGVWFAGGKFGLSWKAVQASVKKPKVNFNTYSFVDEDDDDEVDVRSLEDDE